MSFRNYLLILFMLITSFAFAQRELTGTVTDYGDKTPLVGVNISIKGTSTGVATDLDGKFSIKIPSGENIVIFSYQGFITQEIKIVGTEKVLNIEMKEDSNQLADVIVTARKREQNLQKLSLSISAFDKTLIKSLGMSKPIDIAAQTPGLDTKPSVGDQNPVFTIRGIGFNDFTSIQNPGTAVYVNGVLVPYHPMMNFQMLDMERVEVLKGPQGTLYGRNSTAGAINFVSRKPSQSSNGFARFDVSSYETFDFEAAYGGPISEKLSVRVAISTYQRTGGYMENRITNEKLGKKNRTSGRIMFNWTPSKYFNIITEIHGGIDKSGNIALQHLSTLDAAALANGQVVDPCPPVAAGRIAEGPCVNVLGYFDADGDPFIGDYSTRDKKAVDNKAIGFSLTTNWDISDKVMLTSITGYDKFDRIQFIDADASPAKIIDSNFDDVTKAFSQELRLTSRGNQKFDWMIGAFFSDDSVDAFQGVDITDFLGTKIEVTNDQSSQSVGLYLHSDYEISSEFSIISGLRYTNENKDWKGGSNFIGVAQNFSEASIDNNDLSWHLGLEYKATKDILLYANNSKGWRSGGFPGSFTLDPNALKPFKEETIIATEIGIKSKFNKGKIQLNAAYYHYDWKDLQTLFIVTDPVSGLVSASLTNAGDAKIDGFETNVKILVTKGLLFSGGVNIMKSEIVTSDDARLKGKDLANAPETSFNGILQYTSSIGNNSLMFQLDGSYTGKRFFTPDNIPVFSGKDYTLINARIAFKPASENWEVAIWSKNITDKLYTVDGFNQIGFSGDSFLVYGQPRTTGISLNYKF